MSNDIRPLRRRRIATQHSQSWLQTMTKGRLHKFTPNLFRPFLRALRGRRRTALRRAIFLTTLLRAPSILRPNLGQHRLDSDFGLNSGRCQFDSPPTSVRFRREPSRHPSNTRETGRIWPHVGQLCLDINKTCSNSAGLPRFWPSLV